ncbi:MAG: aminoacyl-histidine dipeptidase [Lachnospiraceae bacterium]|nr:aminoacyl-histidine dipeptidase [Lachnospiraceae bacterium]
MNVLAGLEPQAVFSFFEEISRIPRPSYHEKQISDYLVAFAEAHGLEYYRDDLFNVIMIQEATAGYENEEPIILQGHMDMVCEKEESCNIDFEKEGLTLRVDGDLISAEGTTLGGDDGIALAMILALFSDENLVHPRLEAVFTASEEVGMDGAKGIDLSMLRGHRLLNLDTEDEGVLLCSCAGGSTALLGLPVRREDPAEDDLCYRIEVTGLLGGHSGGEIHKERANANLLMARLFLMMQDTFDFRIVSLAGGKKQNAIPRQTTAKILVAKNPDADFPSFVKKVEETFRKEYTITDPDIQLTVRTEMLSKEEKPVDNPSTQRITRVLNALPCGIQSMNHAVGELVKTSLNLGILVLEDGKLNLEYAVRSSVGSERKFLEQKLLIVMEAFGGGGIITAEYPAWEYQVDSPFRETAITVFEQMYKKKPKVEAIHAGVECGILAGKIKNLDGISIGPDMQDIHTTEERLSIASTGRVYEYVKALLQYKA